MPVTLCSLFLSPITVKNGCKCVGIGRSITRGLAKAGRTANFATVLPDQPKTLATLLNIMSDMGVNVLEVNHERGNLKAPVGSCVVHLLVETRDALHVQQIYETLRAQGYPIMER